MYIDAFQSRSIGSCHHCFFFNDPATTEIYTLSLHDALPIYHDIYDEVETQFPGASDRERFNEALRRLIDWLVRSEEHTSELQSRRDLVCRLLLEKKKNLQTGKVFLELRQVFLPGSTPGVEGL